MLHLVFASSLQIEMPGRQTQLALNGKRSVNFSPIIYDPIGQPNRTNFTAFWDQPTKKIPKDERVSDLLIDEKPRRRT